jgi:hypothetical protein
MEFFTPELLALVALIFGAKLAVNGIRETRVYLIRDNSEQVVVTR